MNTELALLQLDASGYRVLAVLLSVLWQSSILLLAAGALSYALRNRSAAVRHAVWTAAVLVIPLLPVLSLHSDRWSPAPEIAVIPAYAPEAAHTPAPQATAPTKSVSLESGADVLLPSAPVPTPQRYPWALGMTGYLLTVSLLLLWTLAARLRIRRWILDGAPVMDERTLGTFAKSGERIGLSGEILLMEHPGVPAPLVCRVLRPVVTLPAGFTVSLSDAELRAVALHELAHIKRRDTLIFTLVAIVRAVFFFQPLLWYAARRVSHLAEIACDSAALEHEDDPATYAGLLTRVAAGLPSRALSTEMAAGILFSRSAFFRRVGEILSGRCIRVPNLSPAVLTGAVLFGAVAFLVATAFPLTGKGPGSGERAIPAASASSASGKPVTAGDHADASGPYRVAFTGQSRIVVDGGLAEWNGIGADPVHLVKGSAVSLRRAGRQSPQSRQELSAVLRCAADSDFLYISVGVTDDQVSFVDKAFINPFTSLWSRDCLEVLFYGDRNTYRSGQILVTRDSDGSLIVGGSEPIADRKYPYLWESLGVRAALGETDTGYNVELAVPFSVLEWSGWSGNRLRGMNVRVYDRDSRQKKRHLVEWSDRDGSGWRTLALPPLPASGGERYQAKDHRIIQSVLSHIAGRQYHEAVNELRSAGNAPWVNPLLGSLQKNRNAGEASAALSAAMNEARSPCIKRWLEDTRPSLFEKISLSNLLARSLVKVTGNTETRMEKKIRKASTPEKRKAIEHLLIFWRDYRYHDLSILKCSDMILKTDRNIPVIVRIAEYSLENGSNTFDYIHIAECAAHAKIASREFIYLAEEVRWGGSSLNDLAKRVARAETEAELQALRAEIAALQ